MSTLSSITGAIFCGGLSSRMGFAKAGLRLADGKTMIEHVYDALKNVCSRVVLVGHAEGVPESLKHLLQIEDRYLFCGPMSALEALLSSDVDRDYIITPCDLAWVTPEVYGCLLDESLRSPAVLKREEHIEHLIARYSIKELPLVHHLLHNKILAMRYLTNLSQARLIPVPEHLHVALQNVNAPGDLS